MLPGVRPRRPASGNQRAEANARLESARALPPQLLYAQPSSVHFGGFALEQKYEQRISVHNRSHKSVRLKYTMPSKGDFHVRFARERLPFVSAGLSEELIVSFRASAFRHYYDCLLVRCEEVAYASNTDSVLLGKCLVPLHAYPVLNEVQFPTRMDFGDVPLGQIGRRHVDLSCSVPIEFEYEIQMLKAHPSFTVFPLKGVIPANGVVKVEIEFRPLVYATASAELVMLVSQLGFTPMTCVIVGSSRSDHAMASPKAADAVRTGFGPRSPSANDVKEVKASPSKPSAKASGSTNSSTQRPKRTIREATETEDEKVLERVNNIDIPEDLTSVASVNFVLTQQAGKLKPKDLKKAIDANRALRSQQAEEQAKLNSSSGSNQQVPAPLSVTFRALVHDENSYFDRMTVSEKTKQLFFTQELAQLEQQEKDLEFQGHKMHVGHELLTPQQIDILKQMRQLNDSERSRRKRETWRNTFDNQLFNAQSMPTPEMPNPPRGMLPAKYEPDVTPDFKVYKNDMWARRKRVVQRLIRAISTCIIRNRARRRLEKVKLWLDGARTREAVRAKVALDWQRHTTGGGNPQQLQQSTRDHGTMNPGTSTNEQVCYLQSFPVVEEKTHKTWQPIEQPADWDLKFNSLAFIPLRERNAAQLSGHAPFDLPPLPTYVPLEAARALRSGASDECSPSATGDSVVVSSSLIPMDTRTPSILDTLPKDVFLKPVASVRPLLRVQSPRETDSHYVLRPQIVFRTPVTHFGAALDQRVGFQSLSAVQDSGLLQHLVYLPFTEKPRSQPIVHWTTDSTHVQLFDSVWEVSSDPIVPALASQCDDVPCLSDSESDDEDSRRKRAPTLADASQLFEDDAETAAETGYEPGESFGDRVTHFERYRHLIRLERAENQRRQELLDYLPQVSTGQMATCSHVV